MHAGIFNQYRIEVAVELDPDRSVGVGALSLRTYQAVSLLKHFIQSERHREGTLAINHRDAVVMSEIP